MHSEAPWRWRSMCTLKGMSFEILWRERECDSVYGVRFPLNFCSELLWNRMAHCITTRCTTTSIQCPFPSHSAAPLQIPRARSLSLSLSVMECHGARIRGVGGFGEHFHLQPMSLPVDWAFTLGTAPRTNIGDIKFEMKCY